MLVLRCLHPPGGAIALAAALAGAAGPSAYVDAAIPVVMLSVLLTGAAAVYLNLSGRSYPHRVAVRQSPHATTDPLPERRVGYTQADLDAALARYGELLDVSREDLDVLFQEVELEAHRRIHAEIRCSDVMSRDVVTVQEEQSCASALAFLQSHDLRVAPVLDQEHRVVGLVRRAELQAGRGRAVADVLDPFVHRVKPGTAIQTLLPLLSTGAAHEVMVVDDARRLVGLITQTDLLAALYRAHIVEAVVERKAAA
jgi:CBS domain-containing membrane protein